MFFQVKSTLKSNRNHTFKHAAGTAVHHMMKGYNVKQVMKMDDEKLRQ